MPLTPGARLGVYEIVAQIGSGGMGEVYRATDMKLKRQVAFKILPSLLAADADRLSRLEREAEVLASLNHPNIAAIYGFEDGAAGKALVMELVEGDDLAQRIARGVLPLDEALPIAKQIAEALEAAHEQGIVHRDLKPANVKVRPDGTVKVLDFGLAKAMSLDRSSSGVPLEASPTFTSPVMTQAGVILGTAAYMAPEQARGKVVDRRADIWAFGCVLYEMIAGKRPFDGDNVTDVLSGIVSRDPDWTALPTATPPIIQTLLRRCLEKDPRRRLRDIGEARLILERPDAFGDFVSLAPQRKTTAWLPALLGVAIGVLVLTAATLGFLWWRSIARESARVVTRYTVSPPGGAALTTGFRPAVALSANGQTLAFAAASNGVNRIYIRTRSDVEANAVPGSDGGTNPALSPDGSWVAFFAEGNVKKAPIAGPATTLAPARDARGITWSDDGMLILTNDSATPLTRMTVDGTDVRTITTLRTGERSHRWPSAVAGGTAVLFTVGMLASPDSYENANIEAVIISTGERRVVLKGAAMARYCGDGHLLYSRGPALLAIGFDPKTLTTTGSPVQLTQGVGRDSRTGAGHFDCAVDGTLAFVPGTSSELHNLVWASREGKMQATDLTSGPHQEVRISPDGTRAVLLNGTSGNGDVWIYEFATNKYSRLTFSGDTAAPTWSADGKTVYYTSLDGSGTKSTIQKKLADGSRESESLGTIRGRAYLAWVDASERTAVVDSVNPASDRGDILRVAFGSSGDTRQLVATRANEYAAAVSPGGRWLAYESDDTGTPEVYVRDLAGSGARWQVTVAGGEEPHWGRDGRELFYRTANRLMTIPIEQGDTFRAGNPRPLFDGIYYTGIESGRSYDVDPKSDRFLLVRPVEARESSSHVRVVLNWQEELKQRVPTR